MVFSEAKVMEIFFRVSGVAQKEGNTPRLHSGTFPVKSDESTLEKCPIEVPVLALALVLALVLVTL